MSSGSEPRELYGLAERLSKEFDGLVPHETVTDHLNETLERYADARVTMFVPVLAERVTRERLREIAHRAS